MNKLQKDEKKDELNWKKTRKQRNDIKNDKKTNSKLETGAKKIKNERFENEAIMTSK